MTEREQFIEDWREIISGLLPHLTPEEVEMRVNRALEVYDTETSAAKNKTE
jgi:hypothetical protein